MASAKGEGGEWGGVWKGCLLLSRLEDLGERLSPPSGVRGEAPAGYAFLGHRTLLTDTKCDFLFTVMRMGYSKVSSTPLLSKNRRGHDPVALLWLRPCTPTLRIKIAGRTKVGVNGHVQSNWASQRMACLFFKSDRVEATQCSASSVTGDFLL